MKLSKAATRVLYGCKEFAVTDQMLPPNCIDFRVLPLLTKKGLVAWNIYHGYCLTPAGAKALAALSSTQERKP